MQHMPIKTRNINDYLMIVLVVLLSCGLLFLFIASVGKQIESKKSKLQAEVSKLEIDIHDIYRPFDFLTLLLQTNYESADDFDSDIIRYVQYSKEAKLSYLSRETAGFGGTFAYSKNLASVADDVKEEIVRVLHAVPPYEEETVRYHFFISRHGFTVYLNPMDIGKLLDANGTYNTIAAFNAQLLQKSAGWFAQGKQSALIGPYPDPVSGKMIVSHMLPVNANGEMMGVIGCTIPLEDLNSYLGQVGSNLGMLYLVSDTGRVLAGYRYNETLYNSLKPGQTLESVHLELGITPQEAAAAAADPDAVLWRGNRLILVLPVQNGEFIILYAMELLPFLFESNLILWFLLSMITMILTIALLTVLIKYKRELQRNNLYLRQSIEKLDYLSQLDGLTGLMKSEIIIEKIEESIKRGPVVVCMVDIDHFKQINDRYLHTFGNVVLKRIASVIQKHMPNNAYAGRFGGDEFICLFTDTPPAQVCEIAEKIRSDVEALRFREYDATVTLSIGIAQSTTPSSSDVLERADQRLYHVKQNGRNAWLYAED